MLFEGLPLLRSFGWCRMFVLPSDRQFPTTLAWHILKRCLYPYILSQLGKVTRNTAVSEPSQNHKNVKQAFFFVSCSSPAQFLSSRNLPKPRCRHLLDVVQMLLVQSGLLWTWNVQDGVYEGSNCSWRFDEHIRLDPYSG